MKKFNSDRLRAIGCDAVAAQKFFLPVNNLLGWAGASALVMALVYLVMLTIATGWLTPLRQVLRTMLGSVVCIGAGLLLRDKNMHL